MTGLSAEPCGPLHLSQGCDHCQHCFRSCHGSHPAASPAVGLQDLGSLAVRRCAYTQHLPCSLQQPQAGAHTVHAATLCISIRPHFRNFKSKMKLLSTSCLSELGPGISWVRVTWSLRPQSTWPSRRASRGVGAVGHSGVPNPAARDIREETGKLLKLGKTFAIFIYRTSAPGIRRAITVCSRWQVNVSFFCFLIFFLFSKIF